MNKSEVVVSSFEELLRGAVNRSVRELIEQSITKAQADLEYELRNAADRIALSVCSFYDVHKFGQEIRITVRKFEDNTK